MTEEWGPWIEHDGSGQPVPTGTFVEVFSDSRYAFKRRAVGMAGVDFVNSWLWTVESRERQSACPIDRYRIRKPRALQKLRELVESLPEGVDA